MFCGYERGCQQLACAVAKLLPSRKVPPSLLIIVPSATPTGAEQQLAVQQLALLAAFCDVFSPNSA